MSEPESAAVECPICGEEFDPSAAGGWCTNPDCGEWQYLGEEVPDPVESETPADDAAGADLADEGEDPEPTDEGEADEEEADVAARNSSSMADQIAAEASAANETVADDEDSAGEASPADAEEPAAEPEEADGIDDQPAEMGDEESSEEPEPAAVSDTGADASPASAEEAIADEDDDAEEEAVDEGPADADPPAEDDVPAEAAGGSDDAVAAEAAESATDEAEAASTADEAAEETCPDCGAEVAPTDNFCANCGEDLSAAAPTLEECPDCGTAVEDDDSFCANCGEDLDAAREALAGSGEPAGEESAGGAGAPETLVLRARGEELAIGDDETVGREIRRIVTESGGDDDEAVRIHREHVRFVREGGQFYLVDLGDNPTKLNDRRLSKGDREPVEPGDVIELSGVVSIDVDAP